VNWAQLVLLMFVEKDLTAVEAIDFSLLQNAQPPSGAHPASYSVGRDGSFPPGVKRPQALSWPLASVWCRL